MADEEKLLKRLKNGEKHAIDDAIEIFAPYISTVLYNMCGNNLSKEDAEEILSDVFITLWRKAESIDLQKGTLRAYLAAVVRNFALKKLSERVNTENLDDLELSDTKDFVDGSLNSQFLWSAVMSLGEPDSEIFVRYYKFGEKLREISKVMDLNLSTVKTKLSRGKQKLKHILIDAEEML